MVLAGNGGSQIYIHFPAPDGSGLDSCSLPLSVADLGDRAVNEPFLSSLLKEYGSPGVLRLHADELPAEHPLPLQTVKYELRQPLADAGIKASREALDTKVIYHSLDELQYAAMDDCIETIQYITDRIFRQALCSMNRIVISFLHPAHSHLLITTSRDTEKRTITLDDLMVCDISKAYDGQVTVYRAGERKVTSGIQALIAYHNIHTKDILLHVHLLFPVLLDEDFRGCYFTQHSPRTEAFGLELSGAFSNGHPFVLRRNEGIWCRGITPTSVIESMLGCQQKALQLLHEITAAVAG